VPVLPHLELGVRAGAARPHGEPAQKDAQPTGTAGCAWKRDDYSSNGEIILACFSPWPMTIFS
jgi:hypothetical protein